MGRNGGPERRSERKALTSRENAKKPRTVPAEVFELALMARERIVRAFANEGMSHVEAVIAAGPWSPLVTDAGHVVLLPDGSPVMTLDADRLSLWKWAMDFTADRAARMPRRTETVLEGTGFPIIVASETRDWPQASAETNGDANGAPH